jgi:geranylgeranyl pyrophosphate synthase
VGTPKQREQLASVLGNPAAGVEEIESARRMLEETGARDRVKQLARESAAKARSALGTIPLSTRERQFLGDLVDHVVARDR